MSGIDNCSKPLANFVAGGVGGVFDILVRQPFDTVKVRVQSMALVAIGEEAQFRNSIDCFYKTLKGEVSLKISNGLRLWFRLSPVSVFRESEACTEAFHW